VDHHEDQHAHPQVQGILRKIAKGYLTKQGAVQQLRPQLIGTCATAVVEDFLKVPAGVKLLARDNGAVAIVLYSVILIDTANLSHDIAKATDRDMSACGLTSHFAEGLPSQDVWYQQLIDAKTNINLWRSMSAEQILRYDFKAFTNTEGTLSVGISSILCTIEDFVAKLGWQQVLSHKNKAGGYHFYIVLFLLITNDGTKRQQLFFSEVQGRVAAVSKFFRHTQQTYEYQLSEPLIIPGNPIEVIALDQLNVVLSRKAVGPTSIEFLNLDQK